MCERCGGSGMIKGTDDQGSFTDRCRCRPLPLMARLTGVELASLYEVFCGGVLAAPTPESVSLFIGWLQTEKGVIPGTYWRRILYDEFQRQLSAM